MNTYLLLLFSMLYLVANGQDKKECQRMLCDAADLAGQNDYRAAINKYTAAKACDEALTLEVNEGILWVFGLIEGEKKEAVMQRKRADKQTKVAKDNLAKAQRLISFYNFGDEEIASWSYKNEGFAVIDKNGYSLTDFIYEKPSFFEKGIAKALVESKYVFLNNAGIEISERYDFLIQINEKTYLGGFKNSSDGYKDLLLVKKDSVKNRNNIFLHKIYQLEKDKVIATNKKGIWGFIDWNGDWVIEPKYTSVEFQYKNGLRVIEKYKCGVVNAEGEPIIPAVYDQISNYSEGLARVITEDRKVGFVDQKNHPIIPFIYDDAGHFHNGVTWVREGKKNYFINTSNETILKSKHTIVGTFHEGLAMIKENFRYGFIDSMGTVIVPPKFEGALNFKDGYSVVYDKGLHGIINKNGQEIFKPKFSNISMQPNNKAIVTDSGLFGLLDLKTKKFLVPPLFQQFSPFIDERSVVLTNGKWGFMNAEGDLVVDTIYDKAFRFQKGYALVQEGEAWNFINRKGKIDNLILYDQVGNYHDNLAIFRSNSRFGYIDTLGKEKIELEGVGNGDFKNGFAQTIIRGEHGVIDTNGNLLTSSTYAFIKPFQGGFAVVNKNKWGYIDENGKVLGKLKYDGALDFKNGFARILIGTKYGVIDATGQIVIEPNYEFITDFSEGYFSVKEKGHWGILSVGGNQVIKSKYKYLSDVHEGILSFDDGKKRGIMNINEEIKIYLPYDLVSNFFYNLAVVRISNLYGIIDIEGSPMITPKYEDIGPWKNGYSTVTKNLKKGIIDSTGREIVKPTYEAIKQFKEGFCPVRLNDKWGLIDYTGDLSLYPIFDEIKPFYHGFAKIRTDNKWGLLNRKMEIVVEVDYTKIQLISKQDFLLEKNETFGIFSPKNRFNINLPAHFEGFGLLGEENNWIRAKKNGKWGWVNSSGEIKIPFIFDAITPFKSGVAQVKQVYFDKPFFINLKGFLALQDEQKFW